jgi:hypothetical protein
MKNVLVINGDFAALEVLDVIDWLLDEVQSELNDPEVSPLHPWKCFSLICSSGSIGYVILVA